MGFRGAIFDVDGVLVDSPHELAWREGLRVLLETKWREVGDRTSWTPERFTPAVYQQVMAGKPRMAGARAALEYFGVPDVEARAERYEPAKQEQVVRLSSCTSTPRRAGGWPTTRICSATSTSPSPTTSGSTTRSPGAPGSCASSGPSCWSRSSASGQASPPGTPARAAWRSAGSWARTRTTRATRAPSPRASHPVLAPDQTVELAPGQDREVPLDHPR